MELTLKPIQAQMVIDIQKRIFMAMFFLQVVCVCVFKIMLTGSNGSEGMDRWSCINR